MFELLIMLTFLGFCGKEKKVPHLFSILFLQGGSSESMSRLLIALRRHRWQSATTWKMLKKGLI